MRDKIAVILSRFPYPLNKGDKLRAFHQIKYLHQFHDIYLYCLSDEMISAEDHSMISPYCKQINIYYITWFDILKGIFFSILNKFPVQVGYFYSRKIKKKIQADIGLKQLDRVYCQLSRTALYVNDLNCKKVLDFQDAFSTNYQRLSEGASGLTRLFYKRESKTMLAFEQKILQWFDSCTIISEFDKSKIPDTQNKIRVIPNGVDTNYFSIDPAKNAGNITKPYNLCFVGNLSYLPNKNAVFFLVQQIFPLLKKQHPSIRINIAGADTPREIYELAGEQIIVSGFATDIRDIYNHSKIMVAPLFTGAGLQNKILEAMSMHVPCITTSIVNASLNAEPGKHLLIANDVNEFVTQIVSLLTSTSLQQEVSAHARRFVEENYSWDQANQKLVTVLVD